MELLQPNAQMELLKYRLRHAFLEERTEQAREFLAVLDTLLPDPEPREEQFLELYRVLLYEERYSDSEILLRLENALALTRPGFDPDQLPQDLSCEETLLLSHMAVCTDRKGHRDRAVGILQTLSDCLGQDFLHPEVFPEIRLMIEYNLSKYLGLSGEYSRCTSACDRGIALARESGRCRFLSRTLYNRGWALLRQNWTENREEAMVNLRQAYQLACILESDGEVEHIRGFWESNFTEKL